MERKGIITSRMDIQEACPLDDKYSSENMERIKNRIEGMDKYHQLEILKILMNHASKINENKSGVYVNLSFLPKTTIDELIKYIDYFQDQEESLVTMEYQKEEFKNSFFVDKESEAITRQV